MPPTEPKIVGDNTDVFKWGIVEETTVAFINLESISEKQGAQKSEIKDNRGNVKLQAFSQMGEKHYSLSGQFKGTMPEVGDVLDLQAMDDGETKKVVVQEDLEVSESNSDWRKVSCTAIHFPDMTLA